MVLGYGRSHTGWGIADLLWKSPILRQLCLQKQTPSTFEGVYCCPWTPDTSLCPVPAPRKPAVKYQFMKSRCAVLGREIWVLCRLAGYCWGMFYLRNNSLLK